MSITELTRERHGYSGYRVLVQIDNIKHLKYFSTAGLTKTRAKSVYREALALDAKLQGMKRKKTDVKPMTTHCRSTPGRDLGLTGIQISFSQKRGIAVPYFRVLIDSESGKPKFKNFAMIRRGLDEAWALAISTWAEAYGLSDAKKKYALKHHKPTPDHFEALAEGIFKLGYDIIIDNWIDAGLV